MKKVYIGTFLVILGFVLWLLLLHLPDRKMAGNLKHGIHLFFPKELMILPLPSFLMARLLTAGFELGYTKFHPSVSIGLNYLLFPSGESSNNDPDDKVAVHFLLLSVSLHLLTCTLRQRYEHTSIASRRFLYPKTAIRVF